MPAIEPLFRLLGIKTSNLNKEELKILEAELFIQIYYSLLEEQRETHKAYFQLMYIDKKKENEMLDQNFMRLIMNDLISKEMYTLEGIARYTNTDYEIVSDIYQCRISNQIINFFRRLIELHRHVHRQLYNDILKKIMLFNEAK